MNKTQKLGLELVDKLSAHGGTLMSNNAGHMAELLEIIGWELEVARVKGRLAALRDVMVKEEWVVREVSNMLQTQRENDERVALEATES